MNDTSSTPRSSALAVIALVIALLPGCPLVNLIGALLGLIALQRIQRDPARRGGRRVALAAMIGGWLSAAIWASAWWWIGSAAERAMNDAMVRQVETMLQPPATLDEPALRRAWALDAEAPDLATLQDFAGAVRDRYGDLDRVKVTSVTPIGGVLRPQYAVALSLYFPGEQRAGAARFQMPLGAMNVRLERLKITDPEAGDLVLGRVADEGANP